MFLTQGKYTRIYGSAPRESLSSTGGRFRRYGTIFRGVDINKLDIEYGICPNLAVDLVYSW